MSTTRDDDLSHELPPSGETQNVDDSPDGGDALEDTGGHPRVWAATDWTIPDTDDPFDTPLIIATDDYAVAVTITPDLADAVADVVSAQAALLEPLSDTDNSDGNDLDEDVDRDVVVVDDSNLTWRERAARRIDRFNDNTKKTFTVASGIDSYKAIQDRPEARLVAMGAGGAFLLLVLLASFL